MRQILTLITIVLIILYLIWFTQENFTNFGYEGYRDSVNKDLEVVVINLDDAKARWEQTKQMLDDYGFTNVTRLSAVDGRKAKTKWDMPEYKGLPCLQYDNQESCTTHVACYLSHLKAIEYFLNSSDKKWVLILEDDCFLRKNKKSTMRILNKIMKKGIFGWLTGSTTEALLMNRMSAQYVYTMLNQESEFTKNFKDNYNIECLYDWALGRAMQFIKYNHEYKFAGQRDQDTSYITGKTTNKTPSITDLIYSFSWW